MTGCGDAEVSDEPRSRRDDVENGSDFLLARRPCVNVAMLNSRHICSYFTFAPSGSRYLDFIDRSCVTALSHGMIVPHTLDFIL